MMNNAFVLRAWGRVVWISMLSAGVAVSQGGRPRIAILTLENPAEYRDSNIGNGLTGIITTELGSGGKYEIVDREVVDVLRKELALANSDAADPSSAPRLGKFQGAEYYLKGRVSVFSLRENPSQIRLMDGRGVYHIVTRYDTQADVRIDFQLISVKTSQAVLAEKGVGTAHAVMERSEMVSYHQVIRSGSLGTAESSGSLIGRASEQAVQALVRKLNDLASEVRSYTTIDNEESRLKLLEKLRGHVVAVVSSDQVVVDLGVDSGLKTGDPLIEYVDLPVRNKKGEIVYTNTKDVAQLRIIETSSSRDKAMAKVIGSPGSTPKEGDLVRVDVASLKAAKLNTAAAPTDGSPAEHGISALGVDVSAFIRKGDRFYEDGEYSQALEQYGRADSQKRGDADLVYRLLRTELKLKDLLAAENLMQDMLKRGVPVSLDMVHRHSLSFCTGVLAIEKDRLSYRPDKGDDGFSVSRTEVFGIQSHTPSGIPIGFPPKRSEPVAFLEIRFQGEDGKAKKYDLLPAAFTIAGRSEVRVEEGEEKDTVKVVNILLRALRGTAR